MITVLPPRWRTTLLAPSIISAIAAHATAAQDAEPARVAPTTEPEEVVVVGSQIVGVDVTTALPIAVFDAREITATAAVSGDELFRSIPQMGDVSFNSTNGATSSNFARGDVGSVNLRNIGVGNTLVLLNGRRVVAHPGSQADDQLVPVLTYNTNAIPVSGVQRLEVLLGGAAAIYGTDAVAGVVNTVLRDDIDGGSIELQHGGAEGTGLRELSVNSSVGRNFSEGRGNVSMFASYAHRTALDSTDQDFTVTGDRRPLFAGTRFQNSAILDRRSVLGPWGDFQTPASFGTVRQGTTMLTSAGGLFSIQPVANGGCQSVLGGGICIDDGNRLTNGVDRNLRSDAQATYPLSVIPKLDRVNLFAAGHYDVADELSLFGELGYYFARTESIQDAVFSIGSIRMTVPASNYWNPFGPVTFADGSANPNRLPGLNVPAGGLPITINNYRFSDLGTTEVKVDNDQYRALAGLRGEKFGFDWETALLYSAATVEDIQDGISSTLLQRQLALSTPDAYNPFNGGDAGNPTGADATPSSRAALDAIRIETVRKGKSTLALWDLKASRPDVFELPGGSVGMATGVELRRDSQLDDRDPRVDGTLTWTDSVLGVLQPSDLYGVSPTPDTKGSREVGAVYAEFAVPLVSDEMDIPLVHGLEMQVAGRFEHYSDFGGVTKPKVAAAWDLVDGFRLRGSWAEGFRAPNLEQVNASLITRGNNRTDYVLCEADLRAGRITSFTDCSRTVVATALRAGNPDLDPETSTNRSVGAVFEPQFLPPHLGQLTLTVDYWRIDQKDIVGLFGEGNALILDYLLRVQGSSNPNVVRLAPTADDIAAVAGTGLEPVGRVSYVNDQYVNLLPQDVHGLDLGLLWQLRGTRLGDFRLNLNAAQLRKFYRNPSPDIAALLAARDAGIINAGTTITGGGDLVRDNGKPEWRWSASLTWSYEQFTVGAFTQYIDDVDDTNLLDGNGAAWVIDSQITGNLYGQYEFTSGWAADTRVRIGARNITDEKPPLSSTTYGYLAALYQPYPRYFYASISKDFE